jgi:hypothetical protein
MAALLALTEEQAYTPKFMLDFTACRKMKALVEFTTRALRLRFELLHSFRTASSSHRV